jgi:hypothetical protein
MSAVAFRVGDLGIAFPTVCGREVSKASAYGRAHTGWTYCNRLQGLNSAYRRTAGAYRVTRLRLAQDIGHREYSALITRRTMPRRRASVDIRQSTNLSSPAVAPMGRD